MPREYRTDGEAFYWAKLQRKILFGDDREWNFIPSIKLTPLWFWL